MKLQVLIADADPDFQRTMTQALSREGDMEAAGVSSDGLETLSLIQTARPDVVLLDLIQQRLDGLAILRRLAGREDAPPVLVLTGFVNAAVVAECAKLGAAYFYPQALRHRGAHAVPAAVRKSGRKISRGCRRAGSGARTSGKRRHRRSPRDRRTGACQGLSIFA